MQKYARQYSKDISFKCKYLRRCLLHLTANNDPSGNMKSKEHIQSILETLQLRWAVAELAQVPRTDYTGGTHNSPQPLDIHMERSVECNCEDWHKF